MARFRRAITPTGRKMLDVAAADYGLGEAINEWANEIVAGAARERRPVTEVALEEVLQELHDLIAAAEADWRHSARRFREAGWLERAKAIWGTIKRRQPPYKLRVNTKVLLGLSDHSLPVEVRAVYEIDGANEVVTFHGFGCYTPTPRDEPEDTGRAEPW